METKNEYYVQLVDPAPISTSTNPHSWGIGIKKNDEKLIKKAAKHLFKDLSKYILVKPNKGVEQFLMTVGVCDKHGNKLSMHEFDASMKPVNVSGGVAYKVDIKKYNFPTNPEPLSITPNMLFTNPNQLMSNGWMNKEESTLKLGGGDPDFLKLAFGMALLSDDQQKEFDMASKYPKDIFSYNLFRYLSQAYLLKYSQDFAFPSAVLALANPDFFGKLNYYPLLLANALDSLDDIEKKDKASNQLTNF